MHPGASKVDQRALSVWLVDPIGYTGLAYYDVGLANGLVRLGVDVTIVTSEAWLLDRFTTTARVVKIFRGTHSGARFFKGLRYLASLVRLLIAVVAHRPDILHWQYHEVPILEALTIAVLRILGVSQVYTAHELLPWNPAPWDRRVFRLTYRMVNRVMVHREDEANVLASEFGVARHRVVVVGHGAYEDFATPEMDREAARANLDLPASAPIALFFGSIRPSKGLDVLLDAWPLVVRRLPDAVLCVVGKLLNPSASDAFRAVADRAGPDTVRLDFRQVSPHEANLWYAAADVVVLPYRDIVASGVLRYAYSSSRPVVATMVGELPTLVREGETGHLVPPNVPDALADALVHLLSDRALSAELGGNALRYARRELSWYDPCVHTAKVYREILRQQRASGQR